MRSKLKKLCDELFLRVIRPTVRRWLPGLELETLPQDLKPIPDLLDRPRKLYARSGNVPNLQRLPWQLQEALLAGGPAQPLTDEQRLQLLRGMLTVDPPLKYAANHPVAEAWAREGKDVKEFFEMDLSDNFELVDLKADYQRDYFWVITARYGKNGENIIGTPSNGRQSKASGPDGRDEREIRHSKIFEFEYRYKAGVGTEAKLDMLNIKPYDRSNRALRLEELRVKKLLLVRIMRNNSSSSATVFTDEAEEYEEYEPAALWTWSRSFSLGNELELRQSSNELPGGITFKKLKLVATADVTDEPGKVSPMPHKVIDPELYATADDAAEAAEKALASGLLLPQSLLY
ncbi:unnamed protein product [Amoebophrya sp. A120]|nr:unnamed protein product [Amoebophrya sp. A120]|eukprot:GSA120T00022606001.1